MHWIILGDPQELILNDSWRSDLIWLRYWDVLPGNTFGNRQTNRQVCLSPPDPVISPRSPLLGFSQSRRPTRRHSGQKTDPCQAWPHWGEQNLVVVPHLGVGGGGRWMVGPGPQLQGHQPRVLQTGEVFGQLVHCQWHSRERGRTYSGELYWNNTHLA